MAVNTSRSVPPDMVVAAVAPIAKLLSVNAVVPRFPVLELNVRPALVFGPSSPVAAVKNAGKHVVSVASLAAMIVGSPVQFVSTPEAGVPRAGAVIVGDVSVLLVSVSVVARPTRVSVAAGNVSVPEAAAVAWTVVVPLDEPATRNDVVNVGDVPNTAAPVPVSSVNAPRRFADDGVARKVATFDPNPETPVEIGRPVQDVRVPLDGVPKAGVTRAGLFAKTKAPEPVSSVTAVARFADDGVARKVAMPDPSPETPVAMGSPVALVRTTADGVPSAGVTSVGLVANTSGPEPVSSVTAVARFALDGVARKAAIPEPRPDTPVEIGRPVAFVRVAADGVPRSGVVKVGDVVMATLPVPEMEYSPSTPPLSNST